MPILVVFITTTETMALYVLTTSRTILPLPVLVLFVIGGLDFFVMIHVVFRILCWPYVSSSRLIDKVKLYARRGNPAWLKRFVRSCPRLKIQVGDGTVFDRLTSCVIWQFCVDALIDILLT